MIMLFSRCLHAASKLNNVKLGLQAFISPSKYQSIVIFHIDIAFVLVEIIINSQYPDMYPCHLITANILEMDKIK